MSDIKSTISEENKIIQIYIAIKEQADFYSKRVFKEKLLLQTENR